MATGPLRSGCAGLKEEPTELFSVSRHLGCWQGESSGAAAPDGNHWYDPGRVVVVALCCHGTRDLPPPLPRAPGPSFLVCPSLAAREGRDSPLARGVAGCKTGRGPLCVSPSHPPPLPPGQKPLATLHLYVPFLALRIVCLFPHECDPRGILFLLLSLYSHAAVLKGLLAQRTVAHGRALWFPGSRCSGQTWRVLAPLCRSGLTLLRVLQAWETSRLPCAEYLAISSSRDRSPSPKGDLTPIKLSTTPGPWVLFNIFINGLEES